ASTMALSRGTAQRIAAANHERWFGVVRGQVWFTTSSDQPDDSDDVWLAAGEGVRLPAGAEAVVEGQGADVLVRLTETTAAAAHAGQGAWRQLARWARRERVVLQLGVRPAPRVQGLLFSADEALNW